jgi:phosphate:Na+ symporter
VGDVIDKNLMELAKKRLNKQVEFSAEGRQDIQTLHAKVLENLELALSAFTSRDQALAQKVLRHKPVIRDLEQELYQRHIKRLEAGLSESFETSSIHLDVIANYKRINSLVTNIVYPLVQSPEAPLR